ncbi:hypothetical protein CI088_10075 [Enterococcus plantarum]|uniref:Uncharacterized protein n=1 Tax=Enterococcus plantarum TaxID=1077675 RepID=A0A2W4BHK8_9ENTE|nr:hypothetical protein [Enterococcus plantarum]PZL72642.1 hypothetical protein CI088_10075 [Enterococcus plantarum]
MRSVHDYEITEYSMNFRTKKLTIEATLDDNSKKIIFTDVLAYEFSDEIPYSTILDIDKIDIQNFFKNNKELLESKKNSGWPVIYQTMEELEQKIQKEEVNYYILFSSYGMTGWILAQDITVKNN